MSNEPGAPGLTTLGIGAAVIVLQLYLSRRLARPTCRPLRLAAAFGAILICTALLLTGHQAQRTRPAKPDTLDALLLRNLPPAATGVPPASLPSQPTPGRSDDHAGSRS